jgi:hypothetical protein
MNPDPWVSGEPLPGVTFAYNSLVRIIDGPYAGEEGWLVALEIHADPIYTVELRSGGDVEVPQSLLGNLTK